MEKISTISPKTNIKILLTQKKTCSWVLFGYSHVKGHHLQAENSIPIPMGWNL